MSRSELYKDENGLQAADSTCNPLFLLEAAIGFEPMNNGFADRRLTTWLCRLWSGKRDLNPRLQPWQGCTLPLSYSRINSFNVKITRFECRCQYRFIRFIGRKRGNSGTATRGKIMTIIIGFSKPDRLHFALCAMDSASSSSHYDSLQESPEVIDTREDSQPHGNP